MRHHPGTALLDEPIDAPSAPRPTLLIVEDDEGLLEVLEQHCAQRGYRCLTARDGLAALERLREDPPDLVLLDIGLPRLDGWGVLARIRPQSDVPIIFLTTLGDTEDLVRGLSLGADDYLRKPFELRELDARIAVALRRSGRVPHPEVLSVGALCIDDRSKRVTVGCCEVGLTPKELALLRLLASDAGRVFSSQEILDRLWSDSPRASSADVKQYVHLLRRKLARAGASQLIRTVGRFGYQLSPCGEAGALTVS